MHEFGRVVFKKSCTLFFLRELLSGSSATVNSGWGFLSLFKMLKSDFALSSYFLTP